MRLRPEALQGGNPKCQRPTETCYFLPGVWKEKSPWEKPSGGPGSGSGELGVQLPPPPPAALPPSLGPHITSCSLWVILCFCFPHPYFLPLGQ